MLSFDPPKRAMLSTTVTTGNAEGEEQVERVYIHGIDKENIVIEKQFGTVEVVPLSNFSIRLDPNSASLAEAQLRLQGMQLARMPDDRKKHEHEPV